ncbi:fumarate hydratase [Echinicola soli]|uniref:Fumarate hydratase n=1 Tax=Echinicola soli TaxID=2591634 RepID=A0A514CK68_9BACT|nr:fumarate hydratase [Echinicola soli]QDH80208.1 fumarate hydratase [Echinicola soli]
MGKVAVISGDIVSSTSLVKEDRLMLNDRLKDLIFHLSVKFDTYGRVLKGDYVECVCRKPQESLAVALAIKSFVKSIEVSTGEKSSDKNRIKLFKTHGIRLAIGYGELPTFDTTNGVIDGEAIYLAGRKINEQSGRKKKRVVIKQTLFFESHEELLKEQFDPVMGLLDVLISKATARQSEVLYWKLMGLNEDEIAEKFGVSQSVVNQHSTSVGWNAIEDTVAYYNHTVKRHQS